MKDNLKKKLEIMSKRQLGVALDDFVLKEQMQAVNENIEETLRRQQKRLKKRREAKIIISRRVGRPL